MMQFDQINGRILDTKVACMALLLSVYHLTPVIIS